MFCFRTQWLQNKAIEKCNSKITSAELIKCLRLWYGFQVDIFWETKCNSNPRFGRTFFTQNTWDYQLLLIGPIFFTTDPAAQTDQKQKSRFTKSPLMQDWVFGLGLNITGLCKVGRYLPYDHKQYYYKNKCFPKRTPISY